MDTASFQFVLFGLVTAVVSNFRRSALWRSTVLMIASLIFLGMLAHGITVYLPLAGFLLLGYILLLVLQGDWSRSKAWAIVAIIFAYVWLKKYTFLPKSAFLQFPYLTLGLSYIFFRVLHLLIEAGEGTEKRKIGFGRYLLYLVNFTTFVSGPIQRYEAFAEDQFAEAPIKLGPQVVGLQLERIVRGFFKVNVLATIFQAIQSDALIQLSQPLPGGLKFYAAVRLVLVYPLFLFSNFSGYIDIVIALARLMRIRLPENFERPFSASSVLDFWNQWHITLSRWLKNYVYNPLLMALMRRNSSTSIEPFLGVFCFFVTFFLVGIWHGRTSEFVMFGVLTGGGMSVNKFWQIELGRHLGTKRYKKLAKNPVYVMFGRGLNYLWFALTLFFFWGNWSQIRQIATALAAAEWVVVVAVAWVIAAVMLQGWEQLRAGLVSLKNEQGPVLTHRYVRVVYTSALALASVVMTVLLNQSAPGIVYRAF